MLHIHLKQVVAELPDILCALVENKYMYPIQALVHKDTLPKLKVLNRRDKAFIHSWVVDAANETVISCKVKVAQDLAEFTWTDKQVKQLLEM